MKIRRSARTILTTSLVLSVFTALTVWHNQAPDHLSAPEVKALVKQLSSKNPKLHFLMKQMKSWETPEGFYVMGSKGQHSWPEDIARACYSDPLAGFSMGSKSSPPISGEIDVVRYRSLEDFLTVLKEAESRQPGYLIQLQIRHYQVIQEPQLVLSLRLLLFTILGVSGLLAVRIYNR